MADEFQAEVCGGNWWNPTRSAFGSSLCSSVMISDMGSFGWSADLMDMKAKSSDESCSASEGSIIFQDKQKPMNQDSVCCGGGGNLSMDSTLEMMGSGLSSSLTTDWNQTLFDGSKRNNCNYQSILQEDMNSSLSYQQDSIVNYSQIKKDWSAKNFPIIDEGSSVLKPQCFPVNSSSYGYPSSLFQTLIDTNFQCQDSIFGNQSMACPSSATNNCRKKLNEYSSSLPKLSSLLKPSVLPKEQSLSHFQLSNNTPPWNSSAVAMNDVRGSIFNPPQSKFISPTFEDKPDFPKLTTKPNNERVRDLSSVVKKSSSSEPSFKRARIETPSPLPTFKVRKEKLGDRITALQQLVSPFGKTDTASVLHEAIEYIKLLHDQVNVLSTPYLKNGAPGQREQTLNKPKGAKGVASQDLRTRGLCLVPISSTFPVAAETSADFWTPTFG